MKKILFVLLLIFISCSDQNNTVDNTVDQTPIAYNSSNDNFITKEIKYSEFVGEWKLINARYKYTLGELDHIENSYAFTENDKRMVLSGMGFEKICFWRKPEYVKGDIGYNHEENIKSFTWVTASGAPAFMVYVNYEGGVLTLYYLSVLSINNKYYNGSVYEIYQKK